MSFPGLGEPLWVLTCAHQPSHAVSTPSPTQHPLAHGLLVPWDFHLGWVAGPAACSAVIR